MSCRRDRQFIFTVLFAAFLPLSTPWSAFSQTAPASDDVGRQLGQIGQLKPPPSGLGGLGSLSGTARVNIEAEWQREKGTDQGQLTVTAKIPAGYHIYSLTQKPGGPKKSVLEATFTGDVEVTGPFAPVEKPYVHREEKVWPGLDLEEHETEVTWIAPLRVEAGVEPASVTASVALKGQICKNSCQDFAATTEANYAGEYASATPTYRPKLSNKVQWQGLVEPSVVAPGERVIIRLRAKPDEGWHIYQQSDTPTEESNRPTMIGLTQDHGWAATLHVDDKAEVESKDGGRPYYIGPVVFAVALNVPESTPEGTYTLAGLVGFQTCAEGCLPPDGLRFETNVTVSSAAPGDTAADPQPIRFESAKYKDAATVAEVYPWLSSAAKTKAPVVPTKNIQLSEFIGCIGLGLLGGLILNVMPCVLPVIALKVLSFVEQAGQSRLAVLRINAIYSAGIISIFVLLAILAAFFTMMWGEQMQNPYLLVGLTVMVFALALSLLGVWELPIPGFATNSQSQKLQESEGLPGVFFKGVFTTLLAVPCSGPLLGYAFGLMFGAPVWMILTFYISIGVGMASPYLMIGAFPKLISWLPKPGAWMETFKHVLGFVMVFTAIYQLSLVPKEYHFSVLILLGGVAFACWCGGHVPYGASLQQRLKYWGPGLSVAVASGLVGFMVFAADTAATGDSQNVAHSKLIDWKPYSIAERQKAIEEGRTVMVEFTADWCLTCQVNMANAIETPEVKAKLDELNAVALLADWSKSSPEIKQSLIELNSASIPLLAIYPAGKPEQVIVLRDVITKSQLVSALEKAGPSKRIAKRFGSNTVSVARASEPAR